MSRTPCDRIADILDRIAAARAAEEHLMGAVAAGDPGLLQISLDALIYDLLVIGEAIEALPEEWKDERREVPWADASRMRDLLSHHYFRIEADVVRATVDEPLQQLEAACRHLRKIHCSAASWA